MARLTDDERKLLLADYHTGQFTQRQLAKKYSVSTATINKLTKGLEAKHEHKVNAISTLTANLHAESEQNEHEVNAVQLAIDKRTKHLLYFQDSALMNQKKGNELLESSSEMKDVLAHSTLTGKNKETVLGKDIIAPTKDDSEVIEVEIE